MDPFNTHKREQMQFNKDYVQIQCNFIPFLNCFHGLLKKMLLQMYLLFHLWKKIGKILVNSSILITYKYEEYFIYG